MNDIIDLYKKVTVQIATPYSSGTGFWVADHNIIITNEHIIRDNKEVVINGASFAKCMAQVIFSDAKFDLAFLAPPEAGDIPSVGLNPKYNMEIGDEVTAIGHPMGMPFKFAHGKITDQDYIQDDVPYVRHSAILDPGYSGGVLINTKGEVLGINTFLMRKGKGIAFCLPSRFLQQIIDNFEASGGVESIRCLGCEGLIIATKATENRCPECGIKLIHPSKIARYEPAGVAKTIEDLLRRLGHPVDLARRGPNNWEIRQGSANIDISYYEKSGLIIGDAYLCKLPLENFQPLFEYLLRKNDEIQNLTFSLKDRDIVLSLLIFDRYLNVDTGVKLFQHLFKRADHFDDILVNEYGASWNILEE